MFFRNALLTLWIALPAAAPAAIAAPAVLAPVPDGADEQYNYIAGLFERGLHEMVVKEGKDFLREHDGHPRVSMIRFRVGQSLYELGRVEEARDTLLPLETLGEEFEFGAEARFRLGQCFLQLDQPQEAFPRFQSLLSDESLYLYEAATFFSAEALFLQGKYGEASKRYATVLQKGDGEQFRRDALYRLGWSLYRGQEFANAARTFEIFLSQYPGDASAAEARFLRGECLFQEGQHAAALEEFARVSEGEYLDDALLAAGYAAAAQNEHQQAATWFARVPERVPDSPFAPEALLNAGAQWVQARQLERARDVLDGLLRRGDDELAAAACYWRGLAEEPGQPRRALEYFERGLSLVKDDDPLREQLLVARSNALFDAGDFENAEQGFAAIEGGSAEVLYSAAVAALNAQRPEQAIERARELLSRFAQGPYQAGATLVLGEGQFALDQYEEAARTFDQLLEATAPGSRPERPRALSRSAWCLFYLERFPEAAERFSRLANEYPSDERTPEASFMEGRCLLRAGRVEQAETALTRHLQAFRGTKFDADARYDLAQARLALGKADEAARDLEAVASSPESALGTRALFERAELLAAAGKHEQAADAYRRVLDAQPDVELRRPVLYAYAWSCYELERWSDARAALEQLLGERFDAALAGPALELLVSVERGAARPQDALKAYQRYRDILPESERAPEVALVTALAFKEAGEAERAAPILEDADQRWPRFPGHDRVLYELGQIYRGLGRDQEFRAVCRRLEAEHPDSTLFPDASFARGESLFDAGEFEAALDAYAGALQSGSHVADLALYKTAWSHLRLEHLEEAARRFVQVNQEYPDSAVAAESLFLAGECLYRDGRFPQAAAQLDDFLSRYPQHESRPRALFRHGLALGRQERWDDCLTSLGRLLENTPDFELRTEAELWIGEALLHLDRIADAQRRFEKVAEEDRGVLAARAHLGLGHCLQKQGDTEGALGEFLKVALLYDLDDEVCEALWFAGNCLEAMNDTERAAARYRELLARDPDHPRAEDARQRIDKLRAM